MTIFSFAWHGSNDDKADIEAKISVTHGGKQYSVINIGDITLFPTEEQVLALHKALTAHVAELDAKRVGVA